MSWRTESDTGETASTCLKTRLLNRFSLLRKHLSVLHFSLTFTSSSRDEQQRIADIFLSRKAEFLVFTTYIGHYDRSVSLLEDSCRSSPAFASIVHQFEVRITVFITIECVYLCAKVLFPLYVSQQLEGEVSIRPSLITSHKPLSLTEKLS